MLYDNTDPEPTDPCSCGHMIKSHKLDHEKGNKPNGEGYWTCRFCKCTRLEIA